jgi:molybdopterin/thiamine biosynthesis adenylyltransferase
MDGRALAKADDRVKSRANRIMRGRWLRVREPLRGRNGAELLRLIERENPAIAKAHCQNVDGWQTDIVGVVFPEELREGVTGDGWIFIIRVGRGKRKRRREQVFAVRAGRSGRADLFGRIPELKFLADRCVALFGLGGIGGPAAIEFAQGGLRELRLLDHDFVDPGTTVRWPLGFGAAGKHKTAALSEFLQREYPYTTVRTWNRRIGDIALPAQSSKQNELDVLHEMLDGVDLVFDSTAELGVHHLLSDLAWARQIPYLTAHTTLGAAGGLVARIDPQKPSGCWLCLQCALYRDKTIKEPPFDAEANVQPLGCADPTFTGTGFDIKEVTLQALRLSAEALEHRMDSSYARTPWDVAVLSLKDTDGNRVPPQWTTYELPPSPECECTLKQDVSGYREVCSIR